MLSVHTFTFLSEAFYWLYLIGENRKFGACTFWFSVRQGQRSGTFLLLIKHPNKKRALHYIKHCHKFFYISNFIKLKKLQVHWSKHSIFWNIAWFVEEGVNFFLGKGGRACPPNTLEIFYHCSSEGVMMHNETISVIRLLSPVIKRNRFLN